jgi:hypothetical protein
MTILIYLMSSNFVIRTLWKSATLDLEGTRELQLNIPRRMPLQTIASMARDNRIYAKIIYPSEPLDQYFTHCTTFPILGISLTYTKHVCEVKMYHALWGRQHE